jgi:hypothetical protein
MDMYPQMRARKRSTRTEPVSFWLEERVSSTVLMEVELSDSRRRLLLSLDRALCMLCAESFTGRSLACRPMNNQHYQQTHSKL